MRDLSSSVAAIARTTAARNSVISSVSVEHKENTKKSSGATSQTRKSVANSELSSQMRMETPVLKRTESPKLIYA
jgi:hypothetical protein